MAKTGGKSLFTLGEKKSAAVLMPTKFVTAKSAKAKGQRYANLVAYADNDQKTNQQNDRALSSIQDSDQSIGYANRLNAIDEKHPLFNADKLNMTDSDVSQLKKRLDNAQANGNNLWEIAFSFRGDFLVENGLYDPETKTLDQKKLKQAERAIIPFLNQHGFNDVLAKDDDLVWFGVIHQDTDHLNMHLFLTRESPETRQSMLVSDGEYAGQPRGRIDSRALQRAKVMFQNELTQEVTLVKQNDVYAAVGDLTKRLKETTQKILEERRLRDKLETIYHELPQNKRGRWHVGQSFNKDLEDGNLPQNSTDQKVLAIVEEILQNDLQEDYADFKRRTQQGDQIQKEKHGELKDGAAAWSTKKDVELKKRLANSLYRQMNNLTDDDLKTYFKESSDLKSNEPIAQTQTDNADRDIPDGQTTDKRKQQSKQQQRFEQTDQGDFDQNATIASPERPQQTTNRPGEKTTGLKRNHPNGSYASHHTSGQQPRMKMRSAKQLHRSLVQEGRKMCRAEQQFERQRQLAEHRDDELTY